MLNFTVSLFSFSPYSGLVNIPDRQSSPPLKMEVMFSGLSVRSAEDTELEFEFRSVTSQSPVRLRVSVV